MERNSNATASSRLLTPINPAYEPARSITKIPATSPFDAILSHIEKDGGVILTNFASLETMNKINSELEPYNKPIVIQEGYENFFGNKTVVIPGLVGKSDTIANILDTNETIGQLLQTLLTDRYQAVFESHVEELVTEPLLSTSLAFNVSYGSPRQALHRDDMIVSWKHDPNMKITEGAGFSVFLAGSRVTRSNGGTMVILGSHKWEHNRAGRPDEVSFLGQWATSMYYIVQHPLTL